MISKSFSSFYSSSFLSFELFVFTFIIVIVIINCSHFSLTSSSFGGIIDAPLSAAFCDDSSNGYQPVKPNSTDALFIFQSKYYEILKALDGGFDTLEDIYKAEKKDLYEGRECYRIYFIASAEDGSIRIPYYAVIDWFFSINIILLIDVYPVQNSSL